MELKFNGHAAFLLTAADGTRLLTDPYNDEVGYRVPLDAADYVTVSHDHFDHASVENVPGDPVVIKGPGEHAAGGIGIVGVETDHDDAGGAERGKNTVFVFTLNDEGQQVRILHAGDLGIQPTRAQLAAFGEVDVMLVPVGGHYTIDAADAKAFVASLRPRLVVPMHYKTEAIGFPIAPVDDFLAQMAGCEVRRPGVSVAIGGRALKDLPSSATPPIVVLDYVR